MKRNQVKMKITMQNFILEEKALEFDFIPSLDKRMVQMIEESQKITLKNVRPSQELKKSFMEFSMVLKLTELFPKSYKQLKVKIWASLITNNGKFTTSLAKNLDMMKVKGPKFL